MTQFRRAKGKLEHDLTETKKRHLKGRQKNKAVDFLKDPKAKPAVLRRLLFSSEHTDQIAVDKRDYTEVQAIPTLRRARNEVIS